MGACNAAGNIFRLIIVVVTAIAIILQWLCQYRCNFALYKEDVTQGLGVWFLMTDDTCGTELYDPDESDPFVWAARSSLTIAMICGAIAGALVAFEWCCCEVCCAGCLEMCAFMSAWIMSAFVNIIYASELCIGVGFETVTAEGIEAAASDGSLCKMGPASTLNALATIGYGICSILLCFTPQPDPIWRQ